MAELAQRASEAAKSAPADPDFPGLAEPAALPRVKGYDAPTAELGPEDQARGAAEVQGRCQAADRRLRGVVREFR